MEIGARLVSTGIVLFIFFGGTIKILSHEDFNKCRDLKGFELFERILVVLTAIGIISLFIGIIMVIWGE
jgi:uncharacterized membrane protein YqjE